MKKLLMLSALAALAVGANAATLVGTTTYGGKIYSLWNTGTSDWSAQKAFGLTQGNLASVTSAGENAAVAGLLSAYGVGEANLGGEQNSVNSGPNDAWAWLDGETWGYTNWAGDEPNDFSGVQEVVLELYSNGGWNDEGASVLSSYVVTEAVPEPATLAALGVGLAALARRRKKA